MPYNHKELEQRLSICDEKLSNLFTDKELDEQFKQKINAVKAYYNRSYAKAMTTKTVEAIAASYELFVEQLNKVKKGELLPKDALEQIESIIQSRKINVIFYNLAKACELIFWKATTFSLYAGIFGVALPVLIVQPVLGIAVGITMVGALLAAAYKSLKCYAEFKSLSRHNTEYTHEASLVSFFNPAPQEKSSLNNEEDTLDLSQLYPNVSKLVTN